MPPRISYIYISSPPSKTTYFEGEYFNTAGVAGYLTKQAINHDPIKAEGVIIDGLLTSTLSAASYGASGLAGSIGYPEKARALSRLFIIRNFVEDIFSNPISWLLDTLFF